MKDASWIILEEKVAPYAGLGVEAISPGLFQKFRSDD
jgi:hypothetical protein